MPSRWMVPLKLSPARPRRTCWTASGMPASTSNTFEPTARPDPTPRSSMARPSARLTMPAVSEAFAKPLRYEHLGHLVADHLVLAVAEHPLGSRVERGDQRPGVDHDHGVERRVDDRRVASLACHQRGDRGDALADVLHLAHEELHLAVVGADHRAVEPAPDETAVPVLVTPIGD